MRHAKKGYKLGRTQAHRKATLAALSVALIKHKRIQTTITKAKAMRPFVEPLVARARVDTTHNRRTVFGRLRDKQAVTTLFGEIADAVGDRPGGYLRIVRLGQRSGDGAEMAMVELVDYNESVVVDPKAARRRTRRGRRRRASATQPASADATQAKEYEVLEVEADLDEFEADLAASEDEEPEGAATEPAASADEDSAAAVATTGDVAAEVAADSAPDPVKESSEVASDLPEDPEKDRDAS